MTNKQQMGVSSLLDFLHDNFDVNPLKEVPVLNAFRENALRAALAQNEELVEQQLEEVKQYLMAKLPAIEELRQVSVYLQSRLDKLSEKGERPTVTTETRSPHKDKAC